MAIAVRGVGAANGNSSATTGIATTVTPNLPAGTAVVDRVFIYAVSTGTVATPTGWVQLFTGALGSGTAGDTAGTRQMTVLYQDYDGVWTMPTLTCALVSAVAPGIECATIAFSKADNESWPAPTVGTGSDTTAGTGYSVVTGSFADPSSGIAWVCWGFPGTPGTATSPTLTASGATFGSSTAQHAVAGQSTGRDVWLSTYTWPVTTGATAAHTAGFTGTGSVTAGAIVVSQTTTPTQSSQVWNWDDGTMMGFANGSGWTAANSAVRSVSSPDSVLTTRANSTAGFGYIQSPFTTAFPNTRYLISAWVFASAATTYSFSVAGNMSTARLINSNFTPTAGAWKQVSCTVTTGAADTQIQVYITDDPNGAPTSGSTLNVDDFSVLLDNPRPIVRVSVAVSRAANF